MSRFFRFLTSMVLAAFVAGSAFAAENATKEDAIAMVKKGVAHYKAKGLEASLATFSDTEGPFRKGELFLVVMGMDGKVHSHSGMKKMIGANITELKDPNGVYMVKDMQEKAKKINSGWSVEYVWLNPDAKKMETKITYFERADDLIFFCGIYK